MGRLRHLGSGADWLLRGRNFIGRSRSCTICLDHPEVSGEHAVLRWSGSAWEIKDLSSRNGVFVDGQRLPSGDRTTVGAGTRLGFGRDAGYLLVDAGEPIAFATPVTGGAPVEAVGGLLALPGPESPTAMIFRDGDGWSVEQAGDTAGLADDSLIRIGDQSWRLHLPELLSPTDVAADISPQLDDLLLRFSVSRDEEYVELVAIHDRQEFDLQARSHHYALLLLARARLRQSSLPPDRQGWIHQFDLLEQMRVDRNQLHLDIFRVRRQLSEAGIKDAARVVERRSKTSQLRIGVARLEIVQLGQR